MYDTSGLPTAQALEIKYQTRITVLSAREKRLKKRLNDSITIINNTEESLKYLQRSKDD